MEVASYLLIQRNLKGTVFPHKMEEKQKEKLTASLSKELNTSFSLIPHHKSSIFSLFFESGEQFREKKENVFFSICGTNHLEIAIPSLEEEKLRSVEKELEKKKSFAFSSTFGYLTPQLFTSGTGLIASAFLHLPALLHRGEIEESDAFNQEVFPGSLLFLYNNSCIGIKEEEIVESLAHTIHALSEKEKEIRAQWKEKHRLFFQEEVRRAYGMLKHGKNFSALEIQEALGTLLLGFQENWISASPLAILKKVTIEESFSKKTLSNYIQNCTISI